MKKWFICKKGILDIPLPQDCTPIGIAYQKQICDDKNAIGFISTYHFEQWLIKNNYVAFGENCSYLLKGQPSLNKLPIIYSD